MKHCKRILLLVVVMVIVLAGLSCTAFASETGAEDWRIEGNNGEAVTLYPGLEFSTQNTTMVPSWADRISGVDKNVFENAYFDKANKLLFLKVNEKLTSNTKTTFKLEGSWFRSKTITVYVNVGPKYLPNLTLKQFESRMAKLPFGVKSVEVMAGSENVNAAIQGDYVLVKGINEGTARISVQYYSDNTRTSIEAYEFKVSVVAQAAISIINAGNHIPLPTLGFAPDTPFEQVHGSAKGMEIVKGHKHGYIFSSTCLKLSKGIKYDDVFMLQVPMDVWKGVYLTQKPVTYYLANNNPYNIAIPMDRSHEHYWWPLEKIVHPYRETTQVTIDGKDIDRFNVDWAALLSEKPFENNEDIWSCFDLHTISFNSSVRPSDGILQLYSVVYDRERSDNPYAPNSMPKVKLYNISAFYYRGSHIPNSQLPIGSKRFEYTGGNSYKNKLFFNPKAVVIYSDGSISSSGNPILNIAVSVGYNKGVVYYKCGTQDGVDFGYIRREYSR